MRILATQAALGITQLAKLPRFIDARWHNWARLRDALDGTPGLVLPEATEDSEPSWFGFVITVALDAPFTKRELVTERTFWIGVHPGLTDEMVDFMAAVITEFVADRTTDHRPPTTPAGAPSPSAILASAT